MSLKVAPLDTHISVKEKEKAIKRINNNRAAGLVEITAELVKYAPAELWEVITDILNECFEEHKMIDVGKGALIPLQKPGKPKGPIKNLRPVILLLIIRKILSNIGINRMKNRYEEYISQSQSAFRQGRSTADIV